jgi:hypothetical protein
MTPEIELQRAERARQLLEDPMIQEALDVMERDLFEAWLASPARDSEGREWLWRHSVNTRKFRDMLRGTMESGTLALEKLRGRQTIVDRALNVVRR